MDLQVLAAQTKELTQDILHQSAIGAGQIFVLGLSTSEVAGGHIGKNSNQEIGEAVVKTMFDILNERGIYLAVQGCEHINCALAVERELAEKHHLEIVNVLPGLHAGGSAQLVAFKYMRDPVEVEFITAHAGVDIGDTAIGMHIKHVQIPLRPQRRELGSAHVSTLASRPRLIGGKRAGHYKDSIRRV